MESTEERPVKKERRIAIIGTAPTYRLTPWDDPTLEIWCLNDMHVLKPNRVDRWFDLHPFDKMFFHQKEKKIRPEQIPVGYFVRPHGHLETLKAMSIPVYLQQAPPDWPHARTFPKDECVKAFGNQFASSPAWMIALALLEGATEIHIYGIHLATEWEYLKQKPNLTFLLGLCAGRGCKLVIPKGAPILTESHLYAYEPDPDLPKISAQRKLQGLQLERQAVKKAMLDQKRWWRPADPNHLSRLKWLDAQITDAQLGVQHLVAARAPAGM